MNLLHILKLLDKYNIPSRKTTFPLCFHVHTGSEASTDMVAGPLGDNATGA
jgi:hypothetical protein